MAEHATHSHAGGDHSHIPSGIKLFRNMIILMLLLGVTWWASTIDFGNVTINNIIALVIATIKAAFVIWTFMGVVHATKLTRVWVATGFVGLILIFGILGDYFTRQFEPVAGWEKGPEGGGSALQREWPPSKPPVPGNNNFRPRG
jgi:caa(3)-type oxidase subunit IV